MPRAVAIANIGQAFEVVKEMQAEGLAWGDDYRPLGRAALARILEDRMARAIDRHLERMAEVGEADRRNGGYTRRLLTALGSIELMVPRTRRFSAGAVLRAYARREAEVNRMILASFVLGLSIRKVGEALLPILGQRVSAATVSEVAKTLDAAVAGFHARPLKGAYRQLVLDGVVLARKTGAGAIRRPVLVALGIRPDGRKEVVDFSLAGSESAVEWERFLTNLHRRRFRRQGDGQADRGRLRGSSKQGGRGCGRGPPVVRRRQGRHDYRAWELRGRTGDPTARPREEPDQHRLGRGLDRSHRQILLAERHPLDLRHLRPRQGHRHRDGEERRRLMVLPYR
jgi:hypothetical protein